MLLAGTNPSAAARTASARQRGALPAFSMEGKVRPGLSYCSSRFRLTLSDSQVCVVTGAARGVRPTRSKHPQLPLTPKVPQLGNLFAHTLVESGCNAIVLLDVDVKHAEEAAVELEQKFVKDGLAKEGEIAALGLGCDVANEELVKKAFDAIREMFGRIDVLVTAAGIVGTCKLRFAGAAEAPANPPEPLFRKHSRRGLPFRQVPQADGHQC